MTTPISPIQKWQDYFLKQPIAALADLLTKKFYMGALHRNDADEIIYRLFHAQSEAEIYQLDCTLCAWLNQNIKTGGPSSLSAARWAETLQNAFSVVVRLNLKQTRDWLLKNQQAIRTWLRPLFQGPAQDPEADFLRTLALMQKDQSLLPLWMRLCRLEEERPLYFATLGLMGLCKLPEVNGEPQGDIHPAVFSGIIELAEAIDRQVRIKKEGEAFWMSKVNGIMARYPRSRTYWQDHFVSVLRYKKDYTAFKYLNKVVPEIEKMTFEDRSSTKKIQLPSNADRTQILSLIERFPLDSIRQKLNLFLERHRQYANETGYAEFLVKTYNDIGYKIRTQSPQLSRQLIQEAFDWAPNDPFLWNSLAKVEALTGNFRRAEILLWQARRKFPENVRIRTDLASFLKQLNHLEPAELVYRQAMLDFPNNAVCRTGLAEVLRAQGQFKKAEAIYRQAMTDFPDNAVCRNGLAEVLKDQGQLADAEKIYQQTINIFPDNAHAHAGMTSIYLQKNETEKAIQLLRTAHQKFPKNQVINKILIKIDKEFSIEEILKDFESLSTSHFPAEFQEEGEFDELETEEFSPMKLDDAIITANLVQDQQENNEKPIDTIKSESCQTCEMDKIELAEDEVWQGLASLYRFAAQQKISSAETKPEEIFLKLCNLLLHKNPNNLAILLEKGFWLLEDQQENALVFFGNQVFESKNVNALGMKIGYLLAKFQQQAELNPAEWEALLPNHADRSTLIKLEFARQTCIQGNGLALNALEDLRKQLRHPVDLLPKTLHTNENWLRENIKAYIFKSENVEKPLSAALLPEIKNRFLEQEPRFRGITQQCLASIE
ncbi:tetratricopeptide repeat protein [candidate division KSB1 bacterium]|nr:tetratricopeptide repeat protein [candidate division KSB1 bacterium]